MENKELFYKPENGRTKSSVAVLEQADKFCDGYSKFLTASKTERLAVKNAIKIATENGFSEFDHKKNYKSGEKVFVNNRDKALALIVFGTETVDNGTRIAAAHVDSPRLDLKANPLYEECELALFKTHYYGGIRKYQWPTIPLSLIGVVCKKDGTTVEINVGENDGDPCFVVTDLLPHLAAEQSKRTLAEGIKGEELNVLVGSHPFKDDDVSESVKLNILKILYSKYGICEEDFLSAELECVPSFKTTDIGFDRSLIGGYGHDDRVCAYPCMMASISVANPKFTTITVFADKEETGSQGNTGLQSDFLYHIVDDIAKMQGVSVSHAFRNSKCLSADVNAGIDPTFQDVMEKRNASRLNYGAVITKYTGARGKSDTNDASAEFVAWIRQILDKNDVTWQIGELGKVDAGGGGTVAKYIANLGVDTIDLGVPVLSMHSPFEVVSKFDVYMTFKAVEALYQN